MKMVASHINNINCNMFMFYPMYHFRSRNGYSTIFQVLFWWFSLIFWCMIVVFQEISLYQPICTTHIIMKIRIIPILCVSRRDCPFYMFYSKFNAYLATQLAMDYFKSKDIHEFMVKDEQWNISEWFIYEGDEFQMVYVESWISSWKRVQMFHHSYFPSLEEKQV